MSISLSIISKYIFVTLLSFFSSDRNEERNWPAKASAGEQPRRRYINGLLILLLLLLLLLFKLLGVDFEQLS